MTKADLLTALTSTDAHRVPALICIVRTLEGDASAPVTHVNELAARAAPYAASYVSVADLVRGPC